MNKYCIALLLAVLSQWTFAEPLKIVYHLNDHTRAALLVSSLETLIEVNPDADVRVIVHGPAIVRFSKRDSLAYNLETLHEKGVFFGVCNYSMLKRNVKPDDLSEFTEIVEEGGIKRILSLQKKGYGYIKI